MQITLEKDSIVVNNITKQYEDFSLDHVSFRLPKGSIMGFIGENGAGKSTTIKIILDLVKQESGSVQVLGKNAGEIVVKDEIGVVFDEGCFPDDIRPSEINKAFRYVYKNWDSSLFEAYVKKFHLPKDKSFKQLSRGMKMKLAIAVALSHNAKLLILDEATSGLDPVVREQILDVFMEFIQNEENSILLSSHIVSDLEKICDYITFIHEGKILFSMEKDRIMEEYGIYKCTRSELEQLDKKVIVSSRKNKFGAEVLVKRNQMSSKCILENPTLEEIMLLIINRKED